MLKAIIEPLKKGNILENPELWKNAQRLLNLVIGLAGLIIALKPELAVILTPENLGVVGTAISALNVYFTTATTKTIGV